MIRLNVWDNYWGQFIWNLSSPSNHFLQYLWFWFCSISPNWLSPNDLLQKLQFWFCVWLSYCFIPNDFFPYSLVVPLWILIYKITPQRACKLPCTKIIPSLLHITNANSIVIVQIPEHIRLFQHCYHHIRHTGWDKRRRSPSFHNPKWRFLCCQSAKLYGTFQFSCNICNCLVSNCSIN